MIEYEDFRALTDVQWRSRIEPERGLFLAEGFKTIERALLAGHAIRGVISEPRWVPELLAIGVDPVRIAIHDQGELEEITGYHVHRGALAAFQRPETQTVQELLKDAHRVVIMEDVVDHTNVGAIMRSAAAFAIDAVLLSTSCADPLYRRAIKVSMGSVFSVPWSRIPWPSGLDALHDLGFATLALTPAETASDIRTISHEVGNVPVALILGTEGDGLADRTMQRCRHRVRIPMAHGVDSLNVAAAAAVACYELTR